MIIIGSAGRHVGKTEFACKLISRMSKTNKVTGVKVTTIGKRRQGCPRGGKGCGVCASLEKNYDISEEMDSARRKDTSRMLQAGADKVFWLRVLDEHLSEGVAGLLAEIPSGSCIVCESNRSRTVIEPGLFIIIKEKNSEEMKPSCQKVLGACDKVVSFDGTGWDFDPSLLRFHDNHWEIDAV